VLTDIQAYIPEFLQLFASMVTASREFLETRHQGLAAPVVVQIPTNIFSSNGIDVEVGTVHSSKGQTHTATLYLESFYQQHGGGNYESERLSALLLGVAPPPGERHKYVRQSMKMVYVGFSRPTHLLGFAVHKARFDAHLNDINRDEWEVVNV
jgi:DNA helicase-2/ATP-dependent DNA helicase PcrA